MSSGIPYFPQTLPANSVVGRISPTAGPTEAVPLAVLAAMLGVAAAPAPIVSSITALRATQKGSTPYVFVTGYYAAFDGGGGLYCYDATDTTSADNGGSIVVATDGGRWKLQITGSVSVRQFGAKGNNSANDSTAFSNACALRVEVYAPAGTYLINISISNKVIMYGDGSTATILKPYNAATAAITYSSGGPFWTYHSEFHGLMFTTSGANQTGVGFTFGATNPASYTTGMEYYGNVKFYGCRFYNLLKGVQFPFGNIGTEFYSCGFSSNYYGVYALDAKFGGLMHAGNKYFFGGEFDGNVCAVYVSNATGGFGGLSFYGTIIENNNVGCYLSTGDAIVPPSFRDVWCESNGAAVSVSNVTIDVWSGTTVTPTSMAPHAFIFDGSGYSVIVDGGFFTDVNLLATNSRVISTNSRVESSAGFQGYPFSVASADSSIVLVNPETNGGIGNAARVFVRGGWRPVTPNITATGTYGYGRQALVPHRFNKLAGSFGLTNTVVNLTAGSNLGHGSFNVTAGTASDGVIYGTCNTYSIPFTTTAQYVSLIAAEAAIAAGKWVVVTFDVKVISGNPIFNAWDRSANQLFANCTIPETGVWYTVAGMGYSPNSFTLLGCDVGCSVGVTANFYLSAFQVVQFNTEHEAVEFLESKVYVGP